MPVQKALDRHEVPLQGLEFTEQQRLGMAWLSAREEIIQGGVIGDELGVSNTLIHLGWAVVSDGRWRQKVGYEPRLPQLIIVPKRHPGQDGRRG